MTNREKLRAYNRAYYQRNRETILAHNKAWYERNRETVLQAKKARRERHLEKAAPQTYNLTNEADAELIRLKSTGFSFRMICECMGISRNAVIGRFHRIGDNGKLRTLTSIETHRGAT